MYKKTLCIAMLLAALAALPGAAESIAGLPLHVKTIAPGVVRVWVGDHVSSTAVAAIATKKGIVVIDTTNIPKLDQAFRKVIARELGRNDFKYPDQHPRPRRPHQRQRRLRRLPDHRPRERQGHDGGEFREHPPAIAWNEESLKEQKERLASGKVKRKKKAAAEERLIIESLWSAST